MPRYEGLKGIAYLHVLLQPVPDNLFVDHLHFQIGDGKPVGDEGVDLLPLVSLEIASVEQEAPHGIRVSFYLRIGDVERHLPSDLFSPISFSTTSLLFLLSRCSTFLMSLLSLVCTQ